MGGIFCGMTMHHGQRIGMGERPVQREAPSASPRDTVRAFGLFLVVILLLAILSLMVVAYRILSLPAPAESAGFFATTAGDGSGRKSGPTASVLPGFERRGASLVGEFIGQDGRSIRLVLDARTQKLIGARLLGQTEVGPRSIRGP